MDSLRTELVEAQKARIEFIRWKLVLVASIGVVGLGLTESTLAPESKLVLCCIPFVCVYVDTMCQHLSLRVQVIGKFLREHSENNSILTAYEKFVHKTRKMKASKFPWMVNAFALEQLLIPVSSIFINLFVFAYGQLFSESLIIWSAVIGLLTTMFIQISYSIRQSAIDNTAG